MTYEYECDCGARTERRARMGSAPRTVKCPKCGAKAKRIFNSFAIGIDGGIDRKSTFGENMRKRNDTAGRRMRKNRDAPVKLSAYDYGDGKGEEVK